MNSISDGLIDKWSEEAIGDLGEKGWRDVDTNSLLLIIFAAQKAESKRHTKLITRPFWWLLGVVVPGVLWYLISGMMNLP